MKHPKEEPPSALYRRAEQAAHDREQADTGGSRRRATARLIGMGGGAIVEAALRDYLLQAAVLYAVIEALAAGVVATGVGRIVGIVVGVATLVFVFWIIWRRRGAREQYLAVLAAFVALSLTLVLLFVHR